MQLSALDLQLSYQDHLFRLPLATCERGDRMPGAESQPRSQPEGISSLISPKESVGRRAELCQEWAPRDRALLVHVTEDERPGGRIPGPGRSSDRKALQRQPRAFEPAKRRGSCLQEADQGPGVGLQPPFLAEVLDLTGKPLCPRKIIY